jgi:hypothetical protein
LKNSLKKIKAVFVCVWGRERIVFLFIFKKSKIKDEPFWEEHDNEKAC